ncbi:MAG: hypothetical protein LC107_02545 [Chitinophagales bacterium]|nr:hypothetical protein [Chitinophagales bacterium]
MQNEVYTRYLYRMLMEYGEVFVPNVGLFTLDFQGATFQQFMTILQPPSTQILYDGQATKPSVFATLLEDSGMDANLAAHAQSAIATDYKEALRENKVFILPQFGQIENGVFTTIDPQTFNQYRGLKELAVVPIPKGIKHDETFLSDITKKRTVDQKTTSFDLLFPLLVALLVLSIIGYRFTKGNVQSEIPNHLAVKPVEQSKQEVLVIDELKPEDTITDADVGEKLQPLTEKTETSKPQNTPKSDIPAKAKPAASSTPSKSQISDNASSCVVIVGSFKRNQNASVLKTRLHNKGYETYVEDFGGFRRVGIKFDCAKKNPDEFKEEIRLKINKDAWLLEE